MREAIINIIKYRLNMGRTKEEIVTGLAFTLCDTLNLSKLDLINMISKEKPVADHVGNYSPPPMLNLFGSDFKKGEFDKIKSILEPIQSNLNQQAHQ